MRLYGDGVVNTRLTHASAASGDGSGAWFGEVVFDPSAVVGDTTLRFLRFLDIPLVPVTERAVRALVDELVAGYAGPRVEVVTLVAADDGSTITVSVGFTPTPCAEHPARHLPAYYGLLAAIEQRLRDGSLGPTVAHLASGGDRTAA